MATKLNPEQHAHNYTDILNLIGDLRERGCSGCALGSQAEIKGPAIYRGNTQARIMCIGEGPGKEEDRTGIVFSGPAGQLLDKIFAAAGIDTNRDCYLCNVINCRPVAPKGSGKQNKPPTVGEITACKPWLDAQIRIINPRCIVLVGMSAIKGYLGRDIVGSRAMLEFAGKITRDEPFVFAIYHPAAILHSEGDREKHLWYRTVMWEHVQRLKKELNERGIT
jgi:uracil-DNA glycosylase family 4